MISFYLVKSLRPSDAIWRHRHDDVAKWKHFPRYWPFNRSPVNSPHKGQWRGALIFSLICAWISGWVSNRAAGDLRRHRYDVTILSFVIIGSGKCLLPDGTKPLPEPMLTNHQWERERERLSLSAFLRTEDIGVHIVHISRLIITYTLE